jgi:5-methylcytosine-specific restriction endonuclease McrA
VPDLNRVIASFGQLSEHSCQIFGHTCPVFFVNEPLTETSSFRKIRRNIPKKTFLRVVRRDNQTCQICGNLLRDNEIMIDHIIPFSKGGPTEESNLRVLCEKCNRSKGSTVEL